ncbi:hypothetical protein HMPREF1991_02893 [Hoylesella loescheii DSM 19665 = JCM 12249 = ATCC 15930]|uniref:Uncharacterized protein n=1 Tax=Hoylesella loescheii DSM 19665 = JCM 12249 = ATCC 15930 TaxID=1122985 RepID=A0A069QE32_HOYLO|nr:hypothetical protein HMPREF1991_02893 [Hoylesella loescheii DSM 19665 = JCM 12249 = ATCC 15930]
MLGCFVLQRYNIFRDKRGKGGKGKLKGRKRGKVKRLCETRKHACVKPTKRDILDGAMPSDDIYNTRVRDKTQLVRTHTHTRRNVLTSR